MNSASAAVITRASGSNFSLSFLFLPPEKRHAMTAVYAFCREADDAVDEPPPGADSHLLLQEWRAEIGRLYDGKPTLPLTRDLQVAVDRFGLTRQYFDGILAGCEMDLVRRRYATFDELRSYCDRVAGDVGLLCMEIFGFRSERLRHYAVQLGLAFQLTNILRDVQSDAARDRIYLPQDDLARFGVDEAWVLAGASSRQLPTDAFRRLMRFEASRAREAYHQAAALPAATERPALVAAEIMNAIYQDVLRRLDRRGFDVFGPRVRVPAARKLWLALQAWWRCRP